MNTLLENYMQHPLTYFLIRRYDAPFFTMNNNNQDEVLIQCFEFADNDDSNSSFQHNIDVTINCVRLRLLHLNIRSYNKNVDEFLILWQGIKTKFNVIILTEAWLDEDSELMSLDGYQLFRSHNGLNQCDGIVVYLDDSLSSVTCNQFSIGGLATSLTLNFTWANTPCQLLCIYRSPSSSLPYFIDSLSNLLHTDTNPSYLKIIAGDINCDILHPNINSQEERYLDMLYECGYISCIDRITRPNSNTYIDHFFIKLPFHFNACSFILQTSITDHFVIGLEVENNLLIEPSRNSDTQYSKIINWSGIDEALKVESWRRVVEAADVDEAAESFNEILQKNLEQFTTSERVCAKTKKIKPWITSGLLQSMRRRDKLSKEVRRNPYNNQLRKKFIRFRNTLKAAIKRSKYNYYKNKLSEA
ncbi:uncharacterized protein LOC120350360 [Nilaparvata lugens]|uniref:uncharacterized protein LOC120350360 n=1 Tax=Nilaparvata lugens TaxID=108931 RepID=UPI00193CF0C7|nr:uncharacterized protein LOC120350360 [Nilaparvata lugens]